MILYRYNPNDGAYDGYEEAMLDPIATEVEGKDVWLIPYCATKVEPPEKWDEHKIPCFDTQTQRWNIVDDYRGLKLYNKETKEEMEITSLNEAPDFEHWTDVPFEDWDSVYADDLKKWIVPLEVHIKRKRAEIAKARFNSECKDMPWTDKDGAIHMINCERESRSLLSQAREVLKYANTGVSINWKTADGDFIPLNIDDLTEIGLYMAKQVQDMFSKEAYITSLLDNAKTVAAVENISWDMTIPEE